CIGALPYAAEVLLVNDGSHDGTAERAVQAIGRDRRFRVLSHRVNFGRGRALRTGFREARGSILITTEGDLSWGAEVIPRMVDYLRANPKVDAVFASPHLAGGGYRNVPRHRVLLSHVGNRVLSFLYTGRLTMTTGMTRAYRASVIKPHLFTHDGKELHLEISHRLLTLGYQIGEVPAVLSWPAPDGEGESRTKRTNWGRISKLVGSHMAFGLLRGVSRIIVPTLVLLTVAVIFFGGWAVYNLIIGRVSIYLAVLTGTLMVLWINVVVGFFMLHHILEVQKEIWRSQRQMSQTSGPQQKNESDYYFEEALGRDVAVADVP
ncbi:MAG: glycosyltransferase family 2 protein, partial [Pseudomonadota bacterium]|nr:glycosyltransferase family 2 protein [Pseudomonadota bacterium]